MPRFRGSLCAAIPRYAARLARLQRWAPCAPGHVHRQRRRSTVTPETNSGELPDIALIAGDDKVATERRRGDDGRVRPRWTHQCLLVARPRVRQAPVSAPRRARFLQGSVGSSPPFGHHRRGNGEGARDSRQARAMLVRQHVAAREQRALPYRMSLPGLPDQHLPRVSVFGSRRP
jgi:hypothetical protein